MTEEKAVARFMAHGDTKIVSEQIIRSVPEVPWTKSWHPVHHGIVLDNMMNAAEEIGMTINKRQYSVSNDGMNMFGVWTLGKIGGALDGLSWAMGLRNSMDKKFALGIVGGTNVFVCDNLCFMGDFIEFRKHTSGMNEGELQRLSTSALAGLQEKMRANVDWQLALKDVSIKSKNDTLFRLMTYDAIKSGVFPPSKFKTFHESFAEENLVDDTNQNSMFQFHGAVTRMVRGQSFFQVSDASRKAEKLCNNYIEMVKYPGIANEDMFKMAA